MLAFSANRNKKFINVHEISMKFPLPGVGYFRSVLVFIMWPAKRSMTVGEVCSHLRPSASTPRHRIRVFAVVGIFGTHGTGYVGIGTARK